MGYILVKNLAGVRKAAKYLSKYKAFALDTETTSLNWWEADIECMSLSNGEKTYVFPFDYSKKPLPVSRTLDILRPIIEDPKTITAMHNAKYDMHILLNYGVRVRNYWCTAVAAFLVDENRRRSLDERAKDVGMRKLGKYKKVKEEADKSGDYTQYFKYAGMDALVCFKLYRLYRDFMRADDTYKVFRKQENRVLDSVIDMERVGTLIDVDLMKEIDRKVGKVERKSERHLLHMVGGEINLNSPKQLRTLFFEVLGHEPRKDQMTGGGFPSTDAKVLKRLSEQQKCPIAKKLLVFRGINKLRSTYTHPEKGFMKFLDSKNRIHTSINTVGAVTGRFSSSSPNLQNIPRSSEKSFHIRQAFIAPPGMRLIVVDYSQIELRIIAHFSRDKNMLEAYRTKGSDLHKKTAEEITDGDRDRAKNINFGLMYGKGYKALAEELGCSNSEAKRYIDKYFTVYRGVVIYKDGLYESCRKNGFIKMITGRKRRPLNMYSNDSFIRGQADRQIINSKIQGSASDLIKLAMIRIHKDERLKKWKCVMLLQVHDELILQCPKKYVKKAMRVVQELMEIDPPGRKMRVPLIAEPHAGPTWESAKA